MILMEMVFVMNLKHQAVQIQRRVTLIHLLLMKMEHVHIQKQTLIVKEIAQGLLTSVEFVTEIIRHVLLLLYSSQNTQKDRQIINI